MSEEGRTAQILGTMILFGLVAVVFNIVNPWPLRNAPALFYYPIVVCMVVSILAIASANKKAFLVIALIILVNDYSGYESSKAMAQSQIDYYKNSKYTISIPSRERRDLYESANQSFLSYETKRVKHFFGAKS